LRRTRGLESRRAAADLERRGRSNGCGRAAQRGIADDHRYTPQPDRYAEGRLRPLGEAGGDRKGNPVSFVGRRQGIAAQGGATRATKRVWRLPAATTSHTARFSYRSKDGMLKPASSHWRSRSATVRPPSSTSFADLAPRRRCREEALLTDNRREGLLFSVVLMDGSAVMGGANGSGLNHAVFRCGRGKI